MKRDHLVPRVVTAANGKPVTRWVRPDDAAPDRSALPAPVASKKAEDDLSLRIVKTELAKAMSEVIVDEFDDLDDDEERNDRYMRFTKYLNSYSSETVYALDELFHDREESHALLASVVPREESDAFVQDIVRCYDALSATSDDLASEDYSSTFYAVEFYDQIVPFNDSEYPDRRKEQVSALITVTDGMERMILDNDLPEGAIEYRETTDNLNYGAFITDAGIAALTLEKTDDAHRIVSLIRERGLDAGSIRMALEHEVAALSEGAI